MRVVSPGRFILLGTVVLFCGCSEIWTMLPRGPVWDASEEQTRMEPPQPAPVRYSLPSTDVGPRADVPVLPFQIWGVAYALDLVIVGEDDGWDMHEYAAIDVPPSAAVGEMPTRVWLAKDSAPDGTQIVITDLPNAASLLPELTIPVREGAVAVTDRSSEERLDVEISYTNWRGKSTTARFVGPTPEEKSSWRNGSTMHHSKAVALPVLDLGAQAFADAATLTIDGQRYGPDRILGLVPYIVALQQTQGGLIEANLHVKMDKRGAGFTLSRSNGLHVGWQLRRDAQTVTARRLGRVTELRYDFDRRPLPDGREAWELRRAQVYQVGIDDPVFAIRLNPALPDPRWSWDTTAPPRARWAMDVGDGRNYGVGWLEVVVTKDGVSYQIRGTDPWWVAARPFTSTVTFTDAGYRLDTGRFDPE